MRDGVTKLWRVLGAGILSAGITVSVATAQPGPTTMPTSPDAPAMDSPAAAPAPVVPINSSTPRGTLKSLLSAIHGGDVQRIKDLIAVDSPTEQKMVDALSRRAVADRGFRDAAIAQYGADAARALLGGDPDMQNTMAMSHLDTSNETIEGETAVVDADGASEPIRLRRFAEVWKVPASEFTKGTDDAGVEERVRDMSFAADVIDQVTRDVTGGKWKSAAEAEEGIRQQIMEATARRSAMSAPTDPASPDPTTQPR